MNKIRVAFLGLSHIHLKNLAHDFAAHNDVVEIVGMAEIPPVLDEELQMRIKLNVPTDLTIKLWSDYRELLSQDIDVAVITTDIANHADIVEETMSLDIHTVVEKPMALNMEDAKRMYHAYQKSAAELIINWPIAWMPAFNKAKELASSGIIGDVLRVHYRSPATRGPYEPDKYESNELSKLWWYKHDRGGGSISDYAGYGCVLATWITGKIAKKVCGIKKNFFLPFSDVEDYATFTLDFGESLGLIEGSWSTMSNGEIPTGPVVYGTNGVIVADRYRPEVKVYKGFRTECADEVHITNPPNDGICKTVIDFLLEGKPLHELVTADFNMKAMVAFDAGRRSCETGLIEHTMDPFQD